METLIIFSVLGMFISFMIIFVLTEIFYQVIGQRGINHPFVVPLIINVIVIILFNYFFMYTAPEDRHGEGYIIGQGLMIFCLFGIFISGTIVGFLHYLNKKTFFPILMDMNFPTKNKPYLKQGKTKGVRSQQLIKGKPRESGKPERKPEGSGLNGLLPK
jgi:hypothetical protein